MAFHSSAPSAEAAKNNGAGMRASPAGTEISVRTMGSSRPKKTMAGP